MIKFVIERLNSFLHGCNIVDPGQLTLSESTIDNVMFLFWEKGYYDTSISDLVAATGVNRARLYKSYGGKQGLFHVVLQRFRSKVIVDAVAPLSNPARGIEGLTKFFTQFTQCNTDTVASRGCVMLAVAASLPQHEPEAVRTMEELIHYLRSLIYKNIRWQQTEKKLDATLNAEMTADFLVGSVVGLMTLLRSAEDPHMLENHVKSITKYISSLPVNKAPSQNNLHLIS